MISCRLAMGFGPMNHFSARCCSGEIALHFYQVPEGTEANLQEEADGLQQLLAEAGYSFTAYFSVGYRGYKRLPEKPASHLNLL